MRLFFVFAFLLVVKGALAVPNEATERLKTHILEMTLTPAILDNLLNEGADPYATMSRTILALAIYDKFSIDSSTEDSRTELLKILARHGVDVGCVAEGLKSNTLHSAFDGVEQRAVLLQHFIDAGCCGIQADEKVQSALWHLDRTKLSGLLSKLRTAQYLQEKAMAQEADQITADMRQGRPDVSRLQNFMKRYGFAKLAWLKLALACETPWDEQFINQLIERVVPDLHCILLARNFTLANRLFESLPNLADLSDSNWGTIRAHLTSLLLTDDDKAEWQNILKLEALWGARLVNAAQSNDVEELRQVCALIRAQEPAANSGEELPTAMETAIRIALSKRSEVMLSILIQDEKHAQFAQQVLGELPLDTDLAVFIARRYASFVAQEPCCLVIFPTRLLPALQHLVLGNAIPVRHPGLAAVPAARRSPTRAELAAQPSDMP